MDNDEQESAFITKVAKEASIEAINKTFALGLSVTTLRGDDIVAVSPDGTVKFIKKLEKPVVIPEKRVYHL